MGSISESSFVLDKERDASTCEFERQTKRLQFWKAFYDLEAQARQHSISGHVPAFTVSSEIHDRCMTTLQHSASVVMTKLLPTIAHKWAKWTSFASCWLMAMYFLTLLRRAPSLPEDVPVEVVTIFNVAAIVVATIGPFIVGFRHLWQLFTEQRHAESGRICKYRNSPTGDCRCSRTRPCSRTAAPIKPARKSREFEHAR